MAVASIVLLLIHHQSLRRLSFPAVRSAVLAGTLLALGYQFQTAGLAHTTAIKSAFITGLVVILVPLFSFSHSLRPPGAARPRINAIFGALLAFVGLFLLSTPAGSSPLAIFHNLGLGDTLTLACAIAFALHLLALSHATHLSPSQIAPLQIVFATLVMALTLPFGGSIHLHLTRHLVWALLITGLFATAAAFSIQTWAQHHLPAATTALLLTLEPVFALLFSIFFLGEHLSLRSAAGAALILAGIGGNELFFAASTPPLAPP